MKNSGCAKRASGAVAANVCGAGTEVSEVKQLLKGKRVVLIGGHCRLDAKHRLEKAFGLKQLDWVECRGLRKALESFDAHIGHQEVATVLLAIRWSRHSFGNAKTYCDKYGKPLVRVPGGYSPNQVAHQILRQCGDRFVVASSLSSTV